MTLSFYEGAGLVRLARGTLEARLRGALQDAAALCAGGPDAAGVFCTLSAHPSRELRGCMGRLGPDLHLAEAVAHVAVQATQDPRFPPLRPDELDSTTIEISVLSAPERVSVRKGERWPSSIAPGMDGLMLRLGSCLGLLLPQVWDRFDDPVEFLAVLCYKAGLTRPDAWRDPEAVLQRFRVQAFIEETPGGIVHQDAGPWRPDRGMPKSA